MFKKCKYIHRCRSHSKHRISLRLKFLMVVILAAACAAGFMFLSNHVITALLDDHYVSSQSGNVAHAARQLEKYVQEGNIASDDKQALDQWTSRHPSTYFVVMDEETIRYTQGISYGTDTTAETDLPSEYETVTGASENADAADDRYYVEYLRQSLSDRIYPVTFADGTYDVYLSVYSGYQIYQFAFAIELILSILLFLTIFLLYLEGLIRKVRQLQQEVSILEGGGIEHPITQLGSDELGDLAAGLEQMRRSLGESMRKNEQLMEADSALVTSISHDLRTPLTALLLYSELLYEHKYADEEQMRTYLKKLHDKAIQIKDLSDTLFSGFYEANSWSEAQPASPEHIRYALESPLSDLIMYLNSQGFQAEGSPVWPERQILAKDDFLNRIFDNIASNILKYGAKDKPVLLSSAVNSQDMFVLEITNSIREPAPNTSSTHVGLINVQTLMMQQNGRCEYRHSGNLFSVRLYFRMTPKNRQ